MKSSKRSIGILLSLFLAIGLFNNAQATRIETYAKAYVLTATPDPTIEDSDAGDTGQIISEALNSDDVPNIERAYGYASGNIDGNIAVSAEHSVLLFDSGPGDGTGTAKVTWEEDLNLTGFTSYDYSFNVNYGSLSIEAMVGNLPPDEPVEMISSASYSIKVFIDTSLVWSSSATLSAEYYNTPGTLPGAEPGVDQWIVNYEDTDNLLNSSSIPTVGPRLYDPLVPIEESVIYDPTEILLDLNPFAGQTVNLRYVMEVIATDPAPPHSSNSQQASFIDPSGGSGVIINGLRTGSPIGATIPEPATMLLFGFGLLGVAGVGRRKK